MSEEQDLRLKLELFEGPMDLLLYLIKKDHINIHDIPIATVLEQYLGFLDLFKLCNINVAAEYLVIAATLIQIKSRMLIPQNENAVQNGEEEDPRNDLVRRLLEYQKFKEAAEFLREKEFSMSEQVVRTDTIRDYRPKEINFEANMFDLITAFQEALKNVPKDLFFEVMKDEYTVEEKCEFIEELIMENDHIDLSELFARSKTKMELVSTFLAVLELIKRQVVSAVQENLFAKISLVRYKLASDIIDTTETLDA